MVICNLKSENEKLNELLHKKPELSTEINHEQMDEFEFKSKKLE